MIEPVLVTGAEGFLGRALCEELKRRGVRRLFRARRRDADLENPGSARRLVARVKPATVFHLAGMTGSHDAARLWSLHVGGTINLLEALAPRTRVVVTGSSAEYGDASGRKPAREDGPTRPLNAYGASKLSQTLASLSYRHAGLEVVVARVFNTSGPGAPEHLVPGGFARRIARAERDGRAPEVVAGNLAPRRDFVDVRDIARALAGLAGRRVPPGIYNVCSGRGTPISEVLRALLARSKRPLAVRRNVPRRGRDLSFIAGSTAKIGRATGWKPRMPLSQSLADTLEWHRARA